MENMYTTHWIKTKCTVVKLVIEKHSKQVKAWKEKIVKNKLIIDDYLYTLTDNKKSHYTSYKICPKSHQTFSITISKVGLSNYGNKWYYTDNDIITIWSLFIQLKIFHVLYIFMS